MENQNHVISQEQLQQLANIYNALLGVHTCGEDTFTFADCMRALQQMILSISETKE